MTERPKIKFLTAIWGERYIEEFASISLPSYMSPGNLPALAAGADLEILIMTSEDSRDKFDEQPIFARLGALCTIRYLLIDDLIASGNYGVTLTLAFARGIMDSGAEQTSTTFVFMNSDFVLADGALRTTLNKINEGHRCIMAPSLRASTEPTLPHLAALVDHESGTLTIEPRALVQLAFDNLHPTVIGKTVTQELITCATHNQLYWQVDENTLLARHFLMFMLAIRPEVPMPPINSYCDYGFVPELVPSGEFTVLGDSDEFFMLELQSATQELYMLTGGRTSPQEIASELSIWTTKEHRALAEHDVVFRAGETAADLPAARKEFADYFASVGRRMTRIPVPHVDHFYWVLGVKAWASLKFAGEANPPDLPPELGEYGSIESFMSQREAVANRSAMPSPTGLFRRARQHFGYVYLNQLGRLQSLMSRRPNVPIFHHLWLDYRLIYKWLEKHGPRDGQRAAFICDTNSRLIDFFGKQPSFKVNALGDLLSPDAPRNPRSRRKNARAEEDLYDIILLHVYRANVRETRRILEAAARIVKPGTKIAIYVEHTHGESDPSNFSRELAAYVNELLPANWLGYRISVRFAGGRAKRRLRRAEKRVVTYLLSSSLVRLPAMIGSALVWPLVAALTAINNYRHRNRSEICPPYCSSFLITLHRAAGPPRAVLGNAASSRIVVDIAPPEPEKAARLPADGAAQP